MNPVTNSFISQINLIMYSPVSLFRRSIWLFCILSLSSLLSSVVVAVEPDPQLIPQAATATDKPYQPQAISPGGIVIPIYSPDSPFLKQDRVKEAEVYTMHTVPGRIHNIVNIHNPSIEVHTVPKNQNTGVAMIVLAGGGHKRLIIGSEGTDLVPFFYNFGVNTFILRYRLRDDGYNAEVDAVNDTLQAIRLIRSRAEEWDIDPNKIGVMGFSAGGEPSANAALQYLEFDAENKAPNDPLAGVSSRPDFVALIYTGPSALTKSPETVMIPQDVPPSFLVSASYGDARHTVWAFDYYMAMLEKEVPNIEIHMYGNGWHGGGITDRGGIPYGTWPDRFIDWFRDLGFLNKPGVKTKAALDIESYLSK